MHFGGSWIFVAVLPWASRKQVSVTRLVTLFVHSSSLKYLAICETKKIIDERWEHGLKLKHKKCSHENDILYPYSIYSYRNKLEMDFVKLRQLVYSFSPCWSHSMSLSLAFHRFKTLIISSDIQEAQVSLHVNRLALDLVPKAIRQNFIPRWRSTRPAKWWDWRR